MTKIRRRRECFHCQTTFYTTEEFERVITEGVVPPPEKPEAKNQKRNPYI